MNTMLKSTKVSFVVLALAALTMLSLGMASSRNAATARKNGTVRKNANEKAITPTSPDGGSGTTIAMNPVACSGAFDCPNDHGVTGTAHVAGKAGVYGKNDGTGGAGVWGDGSNQSTGVFGSSGSDTFGEAGVSGRSDKANTFGTRGYSVAGTGVWGHSEKSLGVYGTTTGQDSAGVSGRYDGPASGAGWGVQGHSERGFAGVFGSSGSATTNGVFGLVNSDKASGVYGKNDGGGAGLLGTSQTGDAITGRSFAKNKSGVFGYSDSGSNGVSGVSDAGGVGVLGFSKDNDGVSGRSSATGKSGVFGYTDKEGGFGGWFTNKAGGVALMVDGRAKVKVLEITGADLSERFEVKSVMAPGREASNQQIWPGLVVSIDPQSPGRLVISRNAYDHRVAGIISGAGGINTGVLMNQSGSLADGSHPVALSGRVYCWADASNGPIELGDLLTTSTVPGHAMKVRNHQKANGSIIGKAMTGLKEGKGLVLVLVSLQ